MASRIWTENSCTNARILEADVVSYEVVKKRWGRNDYEFVINVSWSYGSRTTTRRSYDDFYNLQCSLLDKFPEEARPKTRIIPWLPGRKLLAANSKKLADERLPELDVYVKSLIQLPEEISQSDMVLTFFETDHHDADEKVEILPADNKETFVEEKADVEQKEKPAKKASKKRRGVKRGSRSDGFIMHQDASSDDTYDDEDEEKGDVFEGRSYEGETAQGDKGSKKRSGQKKKGSKRNSRKDGLLDSDDGMEHERYLTQEGFAPHTMEV